MTLLLIELAAAALLLYVWVRFVGVDFIDERFPQLVVRRKHHYQKANEKREAKKQSPANKKRRLRREQAAARRAKMLSDRRELMHSRQLNRALQHPRDESAHSFLAKEHSYLTQKISTDQHLLDAHTMRLRYDTIEEMREQRHRVIDEIAERLAKNKVLVACIDDVHEQQSVPTMNH